MKFKWNRKGMIFDSRINAMPSWAKHSILQPTPILRDEGEIIRLYAGMRDELGQSRIGYIDVLSKDPSHIIDVAPCPVLDIGNDGFFDDAGVVPSAVCKVDGIYYMYYAGYSLLKKVRFSVLGGLAQSTDGTHFERCLLVPVFERTNKHALFRVPHTILKENDIYRIWYGGGDHFFEMAGYTYPVYDVYYCETEDLLNIPKSAINVLTFENEDEYRVARPYVVKYNDKYCMFLCIATKSKGYRLGYAESTDGYTWKRNDVALNLNVSLRGWDSEMMGYPSFIETKYGAYLFYNGNEYGKYGFGYAELVIED